jgi:uncharacterized protein
MMPAAKGTVLRLTPGKNVTVEHGPSGDDYYAAVNGLASLDNNELLYIKTYSDGWFDLSIPPDRLSLILSIYPPTGNGKFVNSQEIVEAVRNERIPPSEEKTMEIRKLISGVFSKSKEILDYILLEGKAPVNGENSRIDFKVNVESVRVFTSDVNVKVDHRNIQEINSVSKGQLLAVRIPSTRGLKDGRDIFGEVIPALDGSPVVNFRPGDNITTDSSGNSYFAAVNGQVKFSHGVLRVTPVFVVRGDVDYSVGNINFSGDVVIMGDVLDNFQVKADESIMVYKNIGAANIYAGGDLVVRNGIINKKKSRVIVQGDVRCRFIENSFIEVKGSVYVEDYILQSVVSSKKSVYLSQAKKGQIVGGEVRALEGVHARQIGNENEIATRILVGKTSFLTREVEKIDRDIMEIYGKLEKLNTDLNQTLIKNDVEKYKEALRSKVSYNYTIEKLLNRKVSLMNDLENREYCEIRVKEAIFPKTELTLNNRKMTLRTRDSFKVYSFDPKADTIRMENYPKS